PTVANPGVAACLFLMHPRSLARTRGEEAAIVALGFPFALMPAMRYLWLQAGSGNANFYYFQSLGFGVLHMAAVLQFVAGTAWRRKALAKTEK
ncbi:unnamed protein product, partial [Phaeothamnion confervicola]